MKPDKYFVFDLETTGFSFTKNRILEIGCMLVDGDQTEYKQWLLDWNVEIPKETIAINGIDSTMIKSEGIDPKQAFKEFFAYTGITSSEPPILIGHNSLRFDIPFLFENARILWPNKAESLRTREKLICELAHDTAALFKAPRCGIVKREGESTLQYHGRVLDARVQGLKYNLGVVCDALNISREGVVQHRARGDVELTQKIFCALI